MKRILALIIVSGFLCATVAFAAPAVPNYQEGQWEITTTMNIPGMPKEMNKPFVYKVCMDKKNAVPPPQAKEKGEKQCEMTKQNVSGNTVTYTMKCKDGTVSEGKITYSKTSFEGNTTTTTNQGGKKMVMKSTMKGRYLGPCPK